ncbi:MAG: beta-lactamase family protein [Ignavibacteriales bacterium]|nr:beta-lactamase family protein [Ignavibacteriales bacterium]
MKIFNKINIRWLVAFLIVFAACSHNKHPLDVCIRESLTDRLEQYDVKGASVAVILPDGTIHRVCAGISHDTVAVKPAMLFAIGSITKNMVAALILQLAEEGLLSLDDPLHKWLPPYPHVDSTITIRQMLNHTSGIFMFWENQKLWDDLIKYRDSVFTPEVVLTYLKEPHFAPGKGFRYSNTNYLLLAMIATRATHSTLSAEFRRRFWLPLGLKNTFLSIEEIIPQEKLAHVWGDNFENNGSNRDITFLPRTSHESITYGSSGVFTTAEELALWCKSLFENRILKPNSLNQMLNFNTEASTSWCDGYGLGVQVFKKKITDGKLAYGHGGGNIGTSTYMAYLPDYDVSVVVMINFFHPQCPNRMLEDIIEIVTDYINLNAMGKTL